EVLGRPPADARDMLHDQVFDWQPGLQYAQPKHRVGQHQPVGFEASRGLAVQRQLEPEPSADRAVKQLDARFPALVMHFHAGVERDERGKQEPARFGGRDVADVKDQVVGGVFGPDPNLAPNPLLLLFDQSFSHVSPAGAGLVQRIRQGADQHAAQRAGQSIRRAIIQQGQYGTGVRAFPGPDLGLGKRVKGAKQGNAWHDHEEPARRHGGPSRRNRVAQGERKPRRGLRGAASLSSDGGPGHPNFPASSALLALLEMASVSIRKWGAAPAASKRNPWHGRPPWFPAEIFTRPGVSAAAAMAACVAAAIAGRSRPLMMISMIEPTPSGTREASPSFSRRVGQNASNVLATVNLYRLPALDPLAATPPGNGMITPGTACTAATARSAAVNAASRSRPMNQRLPPMSPSR